MYGTNLDCCLFFQGLPAKNDFHIFSMVGGKKKNNILWLLKFTWNPHFSIHKVLLEHILIMAAFVVQWQSYRLVMLQRLHGPQTLNIYYLALYRKHLLGVPWQSSGWDSVLSLRVRRGTGLIPGRGPTKHIRRAKKEQKTQQQRVNSWVRERSLHGIMRSEF